MRMFVIHSHTYCITKTLPITPVISLDTAQTERIKRALVSPCTVIYRAKQPINSEAGMADSRRNPQNILMWISFSPSHFHFHSVRY